MPRDRLPGQVAAAVHLSRRERQARGHATARAPGRAARRAWARSRAQLAKESNDALRDLLAPVLRRRLVGRDGLPVVASEAAGRARRSCFRPRQTSRSSRTSCSCRRSGFSSCLELLEDKKQVIFYGPPGTGKTFVARRLARFLAPDDQHRKTVQFHPSLRLRGLRRGLPAPRRRERERPLRADAWAARQLAKVAEESAEPCVLLIDEINRGNIAKVFGELYYLLEYRGDDDQIDLQYGSEPFELPENFLIIATMNTADRSIAILDAALRRRFHFVEFFPDRWPVEGLLRRWLQRHAPSMTYVADLVDAANRMLPDRHLQIGPSYFMRPNLDRKWLERIWAHSVLPLRRGAVLRRAGPGRGVHAGRDRTTHRTALPARND